MCWKTFGERYSEWSSKHPKRTAIVDVGADGHQTNVSWGELVSLGSRAAVGLSRNGVGAQHVVAVIMPSNSRHVAICTAVWLLGACVVPIAPELTPYEKSRLLQELAGWRTVVVVSSEAIDGFGCVHPDLLFGYEEDLSFFDAPPIPKPGKAIGSGGSTGSPKIILDPKPWGAIPDRWGWLRTVGLRAEQTQLIFSRMHHTMGFLLTHFGLFEGHKIVVPAAPEAHQCAKLIEEHRVSFFGTLPIFMQRMAKLEAFGAFDFSSIESFYHAGGPCPDWVKRHWLEKLGAEKVWEVYGATEEIGTTLVRGDEWLLKPGTVGKPVNADFRIVHNPALTSEKNADAVIGEIFSRKWELDDGSYPQSPTYSYLGARETVDKDGFHSVGDIGWIDRDGYLFLADRHADLIITGGINVFPAEVEAVFSEVSEIEDIIVIGMPDQKWGQRVHAVIELRPSVTLHIGQLAQFARERLAAYKIPKTISLVEKMPRDKTGKIKRSGLRDWLQSMGTLEETIDMKTASAPKGASKT